MPFITHRCDYCQGHRRMEIVTSPRGADGPTTRVMVCPACSTAKPFGLCCPSCGDCRFAAKYTRQRPDGTTVRVKRCRHCGHRVRTQERLVSASV